MQGHVFFHVASWRPKSVQILLSLLSSPHSSQVLLQSSSSGSLLPSITVSRCILAPYQGKVVEISTGPGSEKDLDCFFNAKGRSGGKMRAGPTRWEQGEHKGTRHLVWSFAPPTITGLVRDASNICCEVRPKPARNPGCFAGTQRALFPRQWSPGVLSWGTAQPRCCGGGHAPRQLRRDSHSPWQPRASPPPSLLLPSPEGPQTPPALTQLKCVLINAVQTRGALARTGERVHSASTRLPAWEIQLGTPRAATTRMGLKIHRQDAHEMPSDPPY